MTAGPLTLEDLERLERYWRELLTASSSDAVGAARDVLRLTAALRSVMAERDALRESLRAERTRTLPCGHRMGWCNCGGI